MSAFTDSYSSQDKQILAHQCGLHPWIRGLYEQTSCKNKCVFRECIVSQSYSIAWLLFWQGQRGYCKKEYYFSFYLGLTAKGFWLQRCMKINLKPKNFSTMDKCLSLKNWPKWYNWLNTGLCTISNRGRGILYLNFLKYFATMNIKTYILNT